MIRRVAVVGAVCVGLGTGVVVWMIQPVRNRAVVERPSPAGPAPRAESLPPPADAPSPPAAVPRSSRRQPAAAPPADTPDPPASAIEAGTLRIEADVPGAQVFIDRRFIGIAPVTAENLAPGTHQLNVSAEGFEGIARTIDVEPGPRDLTVRFREVRLDAMLPVVHRHRIGSCTGTLVASAQGLRYETTNK